MNLCLGWLAMCWCVWVRREIYWNALEFHCTLFMCIMVSELSFLLIKVHVRTSFDEVLFPKTTGIYD